MSPLPCKRGCPKCGSLDVYREHKMPGELDLGYDQRDTKRESEFVSIDGWLHAEVLKECIMHHCRECQYDWETAPLK